ncbi:hypothetical protein BaRGS_00021469 [Batillaria attramentaria]|uniref:Uncharacterized protein n=1 Tax=Batillaria attramentaria TaxID=370345 RepID=A0ABD0KJ29_9CAEN
MKPQGRDERAPEAEVSGPRKSAPVFRPCKFCLLTRRVVPESVKAVNHSEHDKDTARRSSPSSMNGVSKFYIGDERQKKVKKMMNGSVPVDANGNNKQSGRFICG